MPGYLEYPANGDPDYWIARILDRIAELIPGWTPGGEGTPEVALAEAVGQVISELFVLVGDVSAAAVRAMGQSLFQVPYLTGIVTTIPVTVVASKVRATIPAGFTVTGTTPDGVPVAFALLQAVTFGNTTTGTLTLNAAAAGEYANGVPAGPLTIATSTSSVVSVTANSASSGGVDPETDAEYQDRLIQTLSTLTRTPILPEDFAVRARDVTGVYRAYAVDGYKPSDGTTNNARTITVVPVGEDGKPVTNEMKSNLIALLDGLREVNFDVFAADPTYTPVNVTFTAVAETGFTPAGVRAAVIARGLQILSPATWAGGDESPPEWTGDRTIRYLEIARELGSVDGVAYLQSLTINGGTSDVTLAGVAALPAAADAASPTTVTGTVA